MNKIVITGLGVISALGWGVEKTEQALLNGKTFVGKMKYLNTKFTDLPVGEVPYSDDELRELLHVDKNLSITRTSLLGRAALHEALRSADILQNRPKRIAFIAGTTVGGMEKSEQYYIDFLDIHSDYKTEYIALHDCGACCEMMAMEYTGKFDMMTTISTACSSAVNSVILGANLIKSGCVDAAIVGGSECLSKFHLDGFHSLMILDPELCKPFDKNRQGLNLGEGAAFLVLETETSATERHVKPICRLSGYANCCDAYHQTASSPDGEGAYLSMTDALKSAQLQPSDIDYINAHGTGTESNDESEGNAIMRVFGNNIPPISSTKSYTGHTTSASGSLECVISILAMVKNFIPANLNFSEKIPSLSFEPVKNVVTNVTLDHILTNSFGFGGNDSSCIFSKI